MKKQFAILGIGRFGSKIARELFYKGQEVIAIDKDENIIEGIKDEVTHAFVGDITDEFALKEAGVADCDCVIIAESTHMESNIIAAQICKGLGVAQVICKAHNTIHGKILAKIGVDQVVFPEQDTAIKLVNRLTCQGMLDYLELGDDVQIIGTRPLSRWVGKSLSELDLRNKHNVTVVAVRRGNENMVIPAWSTIVQNDDVLVLFGREDSLKKLDLDITHRT